MTLRLVGVLLLLPAVLGADTYPRQLAQTQAGDPFRIHVDVGIVLAAGAGPR